MEAKVIATLGHWQPIKTFPKNGKAALVLIDFEDEWKPEIVIAKWKRHARGFHFAAVNGDGSAWHESGAKFWMPLPEMPKSIKRKRARNGE